MSEDCRRGAARGTAGRRGREKASGPGRARGGREAGGGVEAGEVGKGCLLFWTATQETRGRYEEKNHIGQEISRGLKRYPVYQLYQ